jgi:hypothetical protein
MPRVISLARLARIATLPETRGVLVAAAQSATLRDLRWRAVHDRAALVRSLGKPANARHLIQRAAVHPATRELATAGLMFLPIRYMPAGWAATWAANRMLRRHRDQAGAPQDEASRDANPAVKNVTPPGHQG